MAHKSILVALALAIATTEFGSVATTAGQTPLQPQDLFGLSLASTPQVRPDSSLIAYVRKSNDVMTDMAHNSVWLVDPKTRFQFQVSSGAADSTQPKWSANGDRLAYVRATKGTAADILIYKPSDQTTTLVARVERSPGHLAWSPDGRSIAFIMTEPHPDDVLGAPLVKPPGANWAEPLLVVGNVAYRSDGVGALKPGNAHVFVVATAGTANTTAGAPRQLTTGKYDDDGPLAWTPDGTALVFTSKRGTDWQRDPLRNSLFRVQVADGAMTRLSTVEGPYASPSFSFDGRHLAYTGFTDRYRGYENRRLFVADADGGHPRMLAGDLDRSLEDPVWSADDRSIYAKYTDRGVTKVARIDVASGKRVEVATGLGGDGFDLPYSGGDFSVGHDGTLAFTSSTSDRPPELSIVRKGRATQLTRLNAALLDRRSLGRVEALAVKSSFDGAPVDAWLVLPPAFDPARKYPMILEIHGGPYASYGPGFATDGQLYAAAGYVVVYANPRGSTSYGDAFANGIEHSYPGTDYDDLMSTVDAVVAKGIVDPARLFVTGGSGGGVLTAWIVGKTHRFRAAVAQKPVINWSSEVLTSDIYPWMAKYWFGKMPWEDPQKYWALSPLSLVGNITTPTLVVVGDQDIRTPVPESEQLYGALQLRGVPTGLVKVPGAFHDMAARPSHAAAKASAVLAWFARYDVGAATPTQVTAR
ncbi:S9 family peptidase [Sphingosinicellaceae bacterium]|nr:S9 family peptidase [Sphingosinicellaceae bacterium]